MASIVGSEHKSLEMLHLSHRHFELSRNTRRVGQFQQPEQSLMPVITTSTMKDVARQPSLDGSSDKLGTSDALSDVAEESHNGHEETPSSTTKNLTFASPSLSPMGPLRMTSVPCDTTEADARMRMRRASMCMVETVPLPEDIVDPMCDPKNPRKITFEDVSAAFFVIKDNIRDTPCTRSNISRTMDIDLFFKKDFLQYTGSFKERGARYTLKMLTDAQKRAGVVAASAGNHALALSYHGSDLGIPVTVVMPESAPIMKVESCKSYGATVMNHGCDLSEAKAFAMSYAKRHNMLYINGYDHPHILAGQGTLALEIMEQVKDIDAVVIPIGGGGLIAGCALAFKTLRPEIKIIGAEAENCPSFSAAMEAGEPTFTPVKPSLADGLAVPVVGVNAFATARSLIDKIVKVKDEWIASAILRLIEMEKAVVEGAGVIGFAALLQGLLPELKGKKVVVPLCGGNIDTTVLGRCLERGMAVDGRLVKFTAMVSDLPGGIADLTRLIADVGVSIKDMAHERAWIRGNVFHTNVTVVVETRNREHAFDLERALKSVYEHVHFRSFGDLESSSDIAAQMADDDPHW